MTRKEQLLQIITDSINELNHLCRDKGASMFIHGDLDVEECRVSTVGNAEVLSQTFESHMQNNPKFSQIMMSMFGSYLNEYPIQKEIFLSGLDFVDFDINLN